MIYHFDDYVLDTESLTLSREGEPQKLEPQVFALLELLVRHHHRTISKAEINAHVWKGRVVSDAALNSRIRSARLAVGDNGTDQKIIKTIPNIGLRFVAPVQQIVGRVQTNPPSRWYKRPAILLGLAALIVVSGIFFIARSPDPSTSEAIIAEQALDPIQDKDKAAAHAAYQRAIGLKSKNTPQSLALAETELREAVSLNPGFGAAHAAIAEIYRLKYYAQHIPIAEAISQMDTHIETALSVSPNSSKVLEVAATVALFNRKYEEALVFADRSIEKSPYNAEAHNRRAYALGYLGRLEESMAAHEEAVSIEPVSPIYLNDLAWAQHGMGDLKSARETALNNLKWNPGHAQAMEMAAHLAWDQGDYGQYHELLRTALSLNPEQKYAISELIWLYSNIGMEHLSPDIARSKDEIALYHALAGSFELAAQLDEPGDFGYGAEFLPYLSGNFDLAAKLINDEIAAYKFAESSPIAAGDGYWYAKTCYIFRQTRDKLADKYCQKLAALYQSKQPSDFDLGFDHLGGIGWHLLNNDAPSAMRWLDHMIAKNHAFLNLDVEPLYADLKRHPEFASRLTRMQNLAEMHRDTILPQME